MKYHHKASYFLSSSNACLPANEKWEKYLEKQKHGLEI